MIFKRLKALFNPEIYHGWGKSKKYFEGWYFKIVNADETKAFAIIPGISMDLKGNQQSFIQVLDGKNLSAEYLKFSADEFQPNPNKFEVTIKDNYFSKNKIRLNLPTINGELEFKNNVSWPNSFLSPGIMGPFSFVPFMQCYHGIVSMNHTISGKLIINNDEVDFTNGKGYLEKDWGNSFPSAYIWMQSNHFSNPTISIKASVAKIPWLKSSFVGFIAGVLIDDKIIQFTTYNFTKLKKSFADKNHVEIELENKNYKLTIFAKREKATALASPILGFMDGRIEESMTANLEVILYDKKAKKIILQDVGRNAGLEVAGNIEEIIT
ncbi:tocopherol cyclase-like protein [Lutibacter sp. Hel_I_33_5]|nr:tocopherol cyclase-like protein [Lutibacter sp. Hel_I_33_5]